MSTFRFIKYFPFFLLSHLPFPVLYAFSSTICFFLKHVIRYRRKVVFENLKRAFPDKSNCDLKLIMDDFYSHFCDLLVETLKSLSLSEKELTRRFIYRNSGLPESYLKQGKSITVYAAHLGNWEWLVSLAIAFQNPVYGIYLPLSSGYFNRFMVYIRERFGMDCVAAHKAYKFLLDRWKVGETNVSLFIGDQSPPGPENVCWTGFLSQETAFIKGTEAIARRNANAVFFPKVIKLSRGYYTIEFILLWDGVENLPENQITERFANALEEAILAQPAMWLWTHRRWKHSKIKAG